MSLGSRAPAEVWPCLGFSSLGPWLVPAQALCSAGDLEKCPRLGRLAGKPLPPSVWCLMGRVPALAVGALEGSPWTPDSLGLCAMNY